MGTEDDRNM